MLLLDRFGGLMIDVHTSKREIWNFEIEFVIFPPKTAKRQKNNEKELLNGLE
jgi:hypothetical protein